MRRLAALLVTILLVGCTSGRPGGAGEVAPSPLELPVPGPSWPSAGEALQLVTPAELPEAPYPAQMLLIRPGGGAFGAVYDAVETFGLMVWQEGDATGVDLGGFAPRSVSWSDDGLFFAWMHPFDDEASLKRYRWGEPAAEVLVDGDDYIRFVAWRPDLGQVLFEDSGGVKAYDLADGSVSGLGGPEPVGGFSPDGRSYLALVEGLLALVSVDDGSITFLTGASLDYPRFDGEAWSFSGDHLALSFRNEAHERLVVVVALTAEGPVERLRLLDAAVPALTDSFLVASVDGRLVYQPFDGPSLVIQRPGRPGYHPTIDEENGRVYFFSLDDGLQWVPVPSVSPSLSDVNAR